MEVGMLKRKNQSGFTLLEIALVLIVAGLLIGAVIKASGITDTAKSLRLQKQVEELKVAVELFVNKMGRLPGDSSAPPHDGQIDNPGSPDNWNEELAAENFITSETKATINPFLGAVSLEYRAVNIGFANAENSFQYSDIPAPWVQALDEALDDGDTRTGNIVATVDGTPGTRVDATTFTSTDKLEVWVRW